MSSTPVSSSTRWIAAVPRTMQDRARREARQGLYDDASEHRRELRCGELFRERSGGLL
jgi:hypothetical protein